jgi:hypothetical protein
MIHWHDTGLELKRLAGFVLRNREALEDPIGGWIDGELHVYDDWRLKALQERERPAMDQEGKA